MSTSTETHPVRQRRVELKLTQQEAARRAEVSVATWRRLESSTDLDSFRSDNVRGFARALRLGPAEFRQLMGSSPGDGVGDETSDIVRKYNAAFSGGPITAADAMALRQTVVFSDFAPTVDKRFHADSALGCGFLAYLKGEASIREVYLLDDLPELALTQVNNHWLVRMGERIMRIADELGEGRLPEPQCLADQFALYAVVANTEPPALGDVFDMYPGLNTDDDSEDWDDEEVPEQVVDWRDAMLGALLPPDDAEDHRRYDIVIMEAYGQGIYDVTDPRHPLRWFDRDDLRERCQSAIEELRLPQDVRDERGRQALERLSAVLS